jgi:hypothetical protein
VKAPVNGVPESGPLGFWRQVRAGIVRSGRLTTRDGSEAIRYTPISSELLDNSRRSAANLRPAFENSTLRRLPAPARGYPQWICASSRR